MRGQLQGLGPYRLLGLLGEGEHAVVYRAVRDDDGGLSVDTALKVLHQHLANDAAEVGAFLARAEAAKPLALACFAPLQEVGMIDGRPYLTMPALDGLSLDALFSKRGKARLSAAAGAALLCQVVSALGAAADKDLVHGRLDAGSIFIDTDGEVRLLGFGVPGDARTDMLGLTRLIQQLTIKWDDDVAPLFDAWVDRLQEGDDSFSGPQEALAAFPVDHVDRQDGPKALARTVKRIIKRRQKEAAALAETVELAETAALTGSTDASSIRFGTDSLAGRRASRQAGGSRSAEYADLGGFSDHGDCDAQGMPKATTPAPPLRPVDAALAQARWVGWLCAAVVIFALAIEVFEFGG